MATPLNTFKTKTHLIKTKAGAPGSDPGGTDFVYEVPAGVTSIILMAQVTNIGNTGTRNVTFVHWSPGTGEATPLVQDFPVQQNDAVGVLTGKLIVEQENQIMVWADQADELKLTLSFLESLNG